MDKKQSKYWLDMVVDEIQQLFPKEQLNIASGHSPSGNYHVGLLREFTIASAVTSRLQAEGRDANHLDFVDDFDVLRKIPEGIDGMQQQLGKPLYLAKDPEGKPDGNYAKRYLTDLYAAVEQLDIHPKTYLAHQQYQQGKFTKAIELCLAKMEEIKSIITEVSGRTLTSDWAPVQILDDEGYLNRWSYAGWDQSSQMVYYLDTAGNEGQVSYTDGRVKLDWRLDWPARWWLYDVKVEPFGRDHASKGGSYDTGKELVQSIFDSQAPYPIPYEFVMLAGQTKKMSKSAGNVLTPRDALDVMPAEILRYFMLRSRPGKLLVFDSGQGLYSLMDEYSGAEEARLKHQDHPFKDAYEASVSKAERVVSAIKFSHLVMVYQSARGNTAQVMELLARTGYEQEVKEHTEVIEREIRYVQNWLEKYAPSEVKFEVQEQMPTVSLSTQQRDFLEKLAAIVPLKPELDGQGMHEAIYEAQESAGVSPHQAFEAIYQVILGKNSGPKAGWFLASLEPEWLIKRLKLEA